MLNIIHFQKTIIIPINLINMSYLNFYAPFFAAHDMETTIRSSTTFHQMQQCWSTLFSLQDHQPWWYFTRFYTDPPSSFVRQWEVESSPKGDGGRGEGVAGFYIFNASSAQGADSLNCSLFSDFCVGWRRMAGVVAVMASKHKEAKWESISDVWVCERACVSVTDCLGARWILELEEARACLLFVHLCLCVL